MRMREQNDKETSATKTHRTVQIRSRQDRKKNSTKADAPESKKEERDQLNGK